VKFDKREDGSELCVHVLPQALMEPLPGGLRLEQRVVAIYDLMVNSQVTVRLGTCGSIIGRHDKEQIIVAFEKREDHCDSMVLVHYTALQAQRCLTGGFHIGQEIQTAADLHVGSEMVARAGARGIVVNEFSDIRITVTLTTSDDATGPPRCVNVLPVEIVPWCEPPGDMPIGHEVEISSPPGCLVSAGAAAVSVGTRGHIVGGVSSHEVLVSFESLPDNARPIVVDLGMLISCSTGVHSKDVLRCPEDHVLARFLTQRDGFQCDGCSRRLSADAAMFGCRQCDYDLCLNCIGQDRCAGARKKEGHIQLEMQPGKIGLTIDHGEADGIVVDVLPGLQGSQLEVQIGWRIVIIQGEPFSHERLAAFAGGQKCYKMIFEKPEEAPPAPDPYDPYGGDAKTTGAKAAEEVKPETKDSEECDLL
jgi:hypothetical protein